MRRDRVGLVFESYNLVPTLTAVENITLPLALAGRASMKLAATLVTSLRIEDRLRHRPAELSGGQQQRVAAARAMVTRPELVFADEPTGNLDSKSATQLLEMTRAAVEGLGQTVVMVTHDPRAASYADRVVFLADGRIVHEILEPTMNDILEQLKGLGVWAVFKLALKSTLSKKRRLFGTALSVMIGVTLLGRHARLQ